MGRGPVKRSSRSCGGCRQPGCDLERNWITSCSGNWVFELGTSRFGYSKSAAAELIFNWWSQGGESVAGRIKEGPYRVLNKRNAETEQEEQAKKRLSPSPGSKREVGNCPQLKRPLCPRRAVSLDKAGACFGFISSFICYGGSYFGGLLPFDTCAWPCSGPVLCLALDLAYARGASS